jgi:hypothetical protein
MQKIPNQLLLVSRDDQLAYFTMFTPSSLSYFKGSKGVYLISPSTFSTSMVVASNSLMLGTHHT